MVLSVVCLVWLALSHCCRWSRVSVDVNSCDLLCLVIVKYKKWHLVGFLFFSYHTDARSSKHQIVELGKPRMTIWRMRIACWLPKATCKETADWVIVSAADWLRTVHNMCDEAIQFVITNWSLIKCSISAFIWRGSCKLSQDSRDSFPARFITSTRSAFLWFWNLNQSKHSPSQDTF